MQQQGLIDVSSGKESMLYRYASCVRPMSNSSLYVTSSSVNTYLENMVTMNCLAATPSDMSKVIKLLNGLSSMLETTKVESVDLALLGFMLKAVKYEVVKLEQAVKLEAEDDILNFETDDDMTEVVDGLEAVKIGVTKVEANDDITEVVKLDANPLSFVYAETVWLLTLDNSIGDIPYIDAINVQPLIQYLEDRHHIGRQFPSQDPVALRTRLNRIKSACKFPEDMKTLDITHACIQPDITDVTKMIKSHNSNWFYQRLAALAAKSGLILPRNDRYNLIWLAGLSQAIKEWPERQTPVPRPRIRQPLKLSTLALQQHLHQQPVPAEHRRAGHPGLDNSSIATPPTTAVEESWGSARHLSPDSVSDDGI